MLERFIHRQRFVRLLAAWLVVAAGITIGFVQYASEPRPDALPGIAVIIGFYFGMPTVVICLSGWGVSLRSNRHRFLKQLKPYGEPLTVLREIDAEIAAGNDLSWFRERPSWRTWLVPSFILLTPNWLVQVCRYGVAVVPLADMVWVFRRSRIVRGLGGLKRMVHGFRILYEPNYWEFLPFDDESMIQAVADELVRRRPEILAGLRDEWDEASTHGVDRLINEVTRRRRELENSSLETKQTWHHQQLDALLSDVQELFLGESDPYSPLESPLRSTPESRFQGIGSRSISPRVVKRWPKTSLQQIAQHEMALVGACIAVGLFAFCSWVVGAFMYLKAEQVHAKADLEPCLITGFGFIAIFDVWAVWRFAFHSFLWGLRRQLGPHGIKTAIKEIDRELADESSMWMVGRWPGSEFSAQPDAFALTKNWLVQFRPRGSVAIHLSELFWIWKRVVPRFSILAMSPNQYQLGCMLRSGEKRFVVLDTEGELNRLIEELLRRSPALATGWQPKWLDLANLGPKAIESERQARIRAFERLTPSEREAWMDKRWDEIQQTVHFVDPTASDQAKASQKR